MSACHADGEGSTPSETAKCECHIVANISAFQADDEGSIPSTRSICSISLIVKPYFAKVESPERNRYRAPNSL